MKQPRIRKQRAKFQRAKGEMSQIANGKRQRGKKQYKKGKKIAVETNRHCEKQRLPLKDSE